MSRFRFEAPSALDYFASLVADDAAFALLEAAILLGQDDHPSLDVHHVLTQIDELGERLRRRVPADAVPLQKLRFLNRFFFQELGFAGNVNDYYDRRNSYPHEVLATRRGIPITLALLYIEFAGHAGLNACGVSFPGHFLVKLRLPRGEVVIDPFNGHSLSREDLEVRLAPYRRQQGLVGDFDVPLGLFLQSATPRDFLARILRNLKEVHRSERDWLRALAVQDRLVILLPQVGEERRDRGMARAELGMREAAASDLEAYLREQPGAIDAAAVRSRLEELRREGSSRLH